ncbi:PRKAR2B family protein [Megaselia abdita]
MNRRKSVFAESYNPDDDETDERTVYPKSNQQRASLGEALNDSILFKTLEFEQMEEVLDAMFEKKVYPGDYIIRQGDDADNFYVIQTGTYKVFVDDVFVKIYNGTGSFGELALMYNTPRQATVQAETAGTLWALDRKTFRRIILKSAVRRRNLFETLLDSVPMLESLKSSERMNLADALVTKYFNTGERIFEKGDRSNGMYFIEDGEVSIRVYTPDDGEIEIKRLGRGDYFGELSLITNKARAASAAVVKPCKLAYLDVETFERLLGPCREIMKRNIDQYENTLVEMFGGKDKITDIR